MIQWRFLGRGEVAFEIGIRMVSKILTPRARQTLSLIRSHGSLSRAAIIKRTGFSGTAVFRATEELASVGLVRVGEAVADGPGQPSATIHIIPDALFSLGISVMADRAEAMLIDLSGQIRAKEDVTVDGMKRFAIIDKCGKFIDKVFEDESLPRDRLIGIGVAVAGFFLSDGTVNPSQELEDWALVDFTKQISIKFGVPVIVDNIANAAAVGEKILGVGVDFASFCYINVASGFGGGVIIDGQLMRGRYGNAAEIGGLISEAGLPVPHLTSLRHTLAQNGLVFDRLSDMLDSFDPDWPGVESWLDVHHASFTLLFSTLRLAFDCDAIVLGGLIPHSLAQRILARAVWPEQVKPVRRDRPAPAPMLCVAKLPSETATTVGAAALMLNKQVA
jgi:predicted NBD/HSP70 family sugar kinase